MDHPSCKTENQLFTCVSVAHLLLSLNNGLAVGSSCSPLLSLWWAVDTQDLLIRDFDVFCSAHAVLATPQLESMNYSYQRKFGSPKFRVTDVYISSQCQLQQRIAKAKDSSSKG